MIKVKTLEQTCGACPSAWEGTLENGEEFYVRYRFGSLTVRVADTCIYSESVGDSYSGVMSTSDMKPHLYKSLAAYTPKTMLSEEKLDSLLFTEDEFR